MKFLIGLVATGCYSGRFPLMPGTVGSLVALPLIWATSKMGPFIFMGIVFLTIPAATYFAEVYERLNKKHDAPEIVIDEFAGMFLSFLFVPAHGWFLAIGFLVFRFFDILKPFPIGLIDRKLSGGFGTVMDDVVAGLFTNLALQILMFKTTWLG